MNTVIDLGSELLVDRSVVHCAYVQLLLSAVGRPLAQGSPWVAIDKRVAAIYPLPDWFVVPSSSSHIGAA